MDSNDGCENSLHLAGKSMSDSYCESFNSKLRDELLNGEIFYTLKEAKIIIESWRQRYNKVRLHSSLNYKPPATRSHRVAASERTSFYTSSGHKAQHELTLNSDHPPWRQANRGQLMPPATFYCIPSFLQNLTFLRCVPVTTLQNHVVARLAIAKMLRSISKSDRCGMPSNRSISF